MRTSTRTRTLATMRALGDPVRLRIVELLAREELCVCHLTAELDLGQPLVSHHLKVLRDAGLVASERYRLWTYYGLRHDALEHLADTLAGLVPATTRPARRPCC